MVHFLVIVNSVAVIIYFLVGYNLLSVGKGPGNSGVGGSGGRVHEDSRDLDSEDQNWVQI